MAYENVVCSTAQYSSSFSLDIYGYDSNFLEGGGGL